MKTGAPYTLRQTLLLKAIAKPEPSIEELGNVLELTSGKLAQLLRPGSITIYLLEGDKIHFRHIYHSPLLWENSPETQAAFEQKRNKLLKLKLPKGLGLLGKVIDTAQPAIWQKDPHSPQTLYSEKDIGFEVTSMVTVPIVGSQGVIGAIQLLNKLPEPEQKERTLLGKADLALMQQISGQAAPLIEAIQRPEYPLETSAVVRYIADYTGTGLVTDTHTLLIDKKLPVVVGEAVIRREGVFPVTQNETGEVRALMANPADLARIGNFEDATGLTVNEVKTAPATVIEQLLKQFFAGPDALSTATARDVNRLQTLISGNDGEGLKAQVINIIEDAYIARATAIHIDPWETHVEIRYRIDGNCQTIMKLNADTATPLAEVFCEMAGLDGVSETDAQHSAIPFSRFNTREINIDLVLTTAPVLHGVKSTLQIKDKSKAIPTLVELGFCDQNRKHYREILQEKFGLVLHGGPHDCGAGQILLAASIESATPGRNVLYVSNNADYPALPGVIQFRYGKQGAEALQDALLMDPDIIIFDETLTPETAALCLDAAMDGKLVISRIHTDTGASTIARLLGMGLSPYILANALRLVVTHRSLRRLCTNCKESVTPTAEEQELLEQSIGWSGEISRNSHDGCPLCEGMGYRGRVVVQELLCNDEELTRGIMQKAHLSQLLEVSRKQQVNTGQCSLHQDGMMKVKAQLTTLAEACKLAKVSTNGT